MLRTHARVRRLIALRLYTGPVFFKYNSILRFAKVNEPKLFALCRSNRYSTTLHAINSAIVKMGKISSGSNVVYRGVSGYAACNRAI